MNTKLKRWDFWESQAKYKKISSKQTKEYQSFGTKLRAWIQKYN